jgi:hypothetical protein
MFGFDFARKVIFFLKAKKVSEQPHMVLTGYPPRWHKFDPAVHAGKDHLHAVYQATHAKAVNKLVKKNPEFHGLPVEEQKEAILGSVKEDNLSAYLGFWSKKLSSGKSAQKAEHAAVMEAPPATLAPFLAGVYAKMKANGVEPGAQFNEALGKLSGADKQAYQDAIAGKGDTVQAAAPAEPAPAPVPEPTPEPTPEPVAAPVQAAEPPAPAWKPSKAELMALYGKPDAEIKQTLAKWADKMGGHEALAAAVASYTQPAKAAKPVEAKPVTEKKVSPKAAEVQALPVGAKLSGGEAVKLKPGSVVQLFENGKPHRQALIGASGVWFAKLNGDKGWQKKQLAPQHHSGFVNGGYGEMELVSHGADGWMPEAQTKMLAALADNKTKHGKSPAVYKLDGVASFYVVGDKSVGAKNFNWVNEEGEWGAGFTDKQAAKINAGEMTLVSPEAPAPVAAEPVAAPEPEPEPVPAPEPVAVKPQKPVDLSGHHGLAQNVEDALEAGDKAVLAEIVDVSEGAPPETNMGKVNAYANEALTYLGDAGPGSAAEGHGLTMPEFQEGKTTTGVKAYYEKTAGHIMELAGDKDLDALKVMPTDKGNTWKGKTQNSKLLMALYGQAVAYAGGEPAPAAKAPRSVVKIGKPEKVPEKVAEPEVPQVVDGGLKINLDGSTSISYKVSGEPGQMKSVGVTKVDTFDDPDLKAAFPNGSSSTWTVTALASSTDAEAIQHAANALFDNQVKELTAKSTGVSIKPPAKTIHMFDEDFEQTSDGWKNAKDGKKLNEKAMSFQVLNLKVGLKPSPVFLAANNEAQKEVVADLAAAEGIPVGKVLNWVYAAGSPNAAKEGDVKVVNGVSYILQGGRWHKQGVDEAKPDQASGADAVASPAGGTLKEKFDAIPKPAMHHFNNPPKVQAALDHLIANAEANGVDAFKGVLKKMSKTGSLITKLAHNGNVFKITGYESSPDKSHAQVHKYVEALKTATEEHSGKKPKAAKKPAPVAAPAAPMGKPSATKKLASGATVTLMEGWQKVAEKKGSNPGGIFKDKAGQDWYCKFPKTDDHVKNELLTAKFYQMLGVAVPNLKLVEQDGKLGIASKWVDGLSQVSAAKLAAAPGVHEAFVLDAWLANWDVVGMNNDNLMLDPEGKPVHVDVGGGLHFSAMGKPKGDAFGNTVGETQTLLDAGLNAQSAAVFKGVSEEAKLAGGKQLAKMHPNQIKKMCRLFGPGDRGMQDMMAEKLIARREHLLKQLGLADPWNAPPVDISKLTVNASDLPEPIDFSNYQGSGKGLSSHEAINKQNTIDDQALIDFAKAGNLKALQDYHYDAFEKGTGKPLGKKPIGDHPAKDIKNHWAVLCDILKAIAHPPVEGLELPPIGGGSVQEVSEQAGFIKPGENISTISPEKVIGFWMKLGHVGADAVADLKPAQTSYLNKDSIAAAKKWWSGVGAKTKKLISKIVGSGSHNHYWSNGSTSINMDGKSVGVQEAALDCYQNAVEKPEGTMITRWMSMPDVMVKQLLKEGPGLVFQNTDSMCTSMMKDWGDSAHFGSKALLKITYAEGAKALDTFGKDGYGFKTSKFDADGHALYTPGAEEEVTTLMGQRFVVLKCEQGNPGDPNGITMEVLMLPPHEGYLAELSNMAALGKSMVLFITSTVKDKSGKA